MESLLIIPKDRKPLRTGRLCLLMGLTALLFLLVADRFGETARIIVTATP